MNEAIVDVDDLTIYRTDGISTGGVRESVLLPLKSVKGELIRGKDCIWRYQSQINDLHYCFVMNIEVSDDDFCSRAKRRIE